jgi:hypothetical protein
MLTLSANVTYMALTIFLITAVLKNSVLKRTDSSFLALCVAIVLTPVAMASGYLTMDFKSVLDMIVALFGAKFSQDAIVKPIKDLLKSS